MKVITDQVPIFDNRNQQFVLASLLEGVDIDRIAKLSLDWQHKRATIKENKLAAGLSFPEHSHWNWELKAQKAELFAGFQSILAIEYQGEIEGLMIVDFALHLAKLPPDREKTLLYIAYIETAPHNLYEEPRRFSAIGYNLYRTAVEYSLDKGCDGRTGLHALPQAETFYSKRCQMTVMEKDPQYQNLRYFESTQEQSRCFLSNHSQE